MEDRTNNLIQQYFAVAWAQIAALWSRFPIKVSDLAGTVYATTAEIADLGPAESAGTSATITRGDHIHALPYATTANIANVADTEAAGTSATVARGDHVHDLTDGMVLNVHVGASAEIAMTKLQPYEFLAYVGTTVTNVTGAGTTYTVIFNTEVMDAGAAYNTGTGTFTAPVTGTYHFDVSVSVPEVSAAMTQGWIEIVTSNRTYRGFRVNAGAVRDGGNVVGFVMSATCDMDASDTATVALKIFNGAGNTADVEGGSTLVSYFGGYQVA